MTLYKWTWCSQVITYIYIYCAQCCVMLCRTLCVLIPSPAVAAPCFMPLLCFTNWVKLGVELVTEQYPPKLSEAGVVKPIFMQTLGPLYDDLMGCRFQFQSHQLLLVAPNAKHIKSAIKYPCMSAKPNQQQFKAAKLPCTCSWHRI